MPDDETVVIESGGTRTRFDLPALAGDELDAFTEAGRFNEREAEVIRAVADRARDEVVPAFP